jgi:hypothetical protein
MALKNFLTRLFSLLFCLVVFLSKPVLALDNNKFGIHILEPDELEKAVRLVNSSGGDWGYITIVLRNNDLDKEKWQKFFNDCRRLHIIPIVRIATHMTDKGVWQKPDLNNLEKWSNFLADLNWPVKKQIVAVFNEPNHAKEWGGQVNPAEYARVLEKIINLFKSKDNNFFVIPAGLDQAADGVNGTLREDNFLNIMQQTVPGIFNKIDGWNSHSYPNHGFIGLPEDTGKASIKGYIWELEYLKSLGLKKELDVFITETGWPHQEGVVDAFNFYNQDEAAKLLKKAFLLWQKDDQVKAVTPFVLNYPEPPFDHFSWTGKDGVFYPQYNKVIGMEKKQGLPLQKQGFEIKNLNLTDLLPTSYIYKGKVTIKNTGQWIIGEREVFKLVVTQNEPQIEVSEISLPENKLLFPGEEVTLDFYLKTGSKTMEKKLRFFDKEATIYIYKPFDLKNNKVSLWQQIITSFKLWWYNFKSD